MINYLKYRLFVGPEITLCENALLSFSAKFGSEPSDVREAITNIFYNLDSDIIKDGIFHKAISNYTSLLKDLFTKIPLSFQKKQFESFIKNSVTEDHAYLKNSEVNRNTIKNYILITYAGIILPQLEKEKTILFLETLEQNLCKAHLGDSIRQYFERHFLSKWNLENELAIKPEIIKKKINKI